MKAGDGSLGSHEAEGVGGEGFYITQSGRRVNLHVSGWGPEVSLFIARACSAPLQACSPSAQVKAAGAQVGNLN
jgi:hypothetical protein